MAASPQAHQQEEQLVRTLNILISQSEIGPYTYLLSRFLISYHNLRSERGRARDCIYLTSRREIGNILRSAEQWLIWEKIYELKATTVPELVEVLNCDDQTAWRLIRSLIKMRILKVTNRLPHPKGRGNETQIISLVDASPEASQDAATRVRPIIGKNKPKPADQYEELTQTLLAKFSLDPHGHEWWVREIAETRPDIEIKDRIALAQRIARINQKGGV